VTFDGQNEFVAWLTSKPFLLYQIIASVGIISMDDMADTHI